MLSMGVEILIGGQLGSEGKGKIAAYLSPEHDLAIRTGGPNAGHTIEHEGRVYKLQSIPCSFINANCMLAIGAGGVIDLEILKREIQECGVTPDRLIIDPQASIITDSHVQSEVTLKGTIGSTGKGVGAAVSAKVLRGDNVPLARDIEWLQPYIGDVSGYANQFIDSGKKVFLEGTQGFGLSIHHGIYPYVTSRDISAGTICGDAGVSPLSVEEIIMVLRTYPIRVGGNSGPFPNEIDWETVTKRSGSPDPIIEMTTVTKKVRRVAEFDMDAVKRATMINRPTQIALMFIDYIDYQNRGVTDFDALTLKARDFVERVEHETSTPVTMIGTGPNNSDIIDLRNDKLKQK